MLSRDTLLQFLSIYRATLQYTVHLGILSLQLGEIKPECLFSIPNAGFIHLYAP